MLWVINQLPSILREYSNSLVTVTKYLADTTLRRFIPAQVSGHATTGGGAWGLGGNGALLVVITT